MPGPEMNLGHNALLGTWVETYLSKARGLGFRWTSDEVLKSILWEALDTAPSVILGA